MRKRLVRIGNSRGVRFTKEELAEAGVADSDEVMVSLAAVPRGLRPRPGGLARLPPLPPGATLDDLAQEAAWEDHVRSRGGR